MIAGDDHRLSPETLVTKIRAVIAQALLKCIASHGWHSPRTSSPRTHYFTEKIIYNSGHIARTRDSYRIVVPLFVMALTPRRFHSSRISLVPKRVRDCSSRGTGFEKKKINGEEKKRCDFRDNRSVTPQQSVRDIFSCGQLCEIYPCTQNWKRLQMWIKSQLLFYIFCRLSRGENEW